MAQHIIIGDAPAFKVLSLFIPEAQKNQAPFQFSTPDLDQWPHQEADHAESMVQQFAESERQTRENKYYGLWSSASAFLCARHSAETLRLESSPVAELMFVAELSPEEIAQMKDVNWDVEDPAKKNLKPFSTASVTPEPDVQYMSSNELRSLRDGGLDGSAWVLTTTKEERRAMSRKLESTVAPAPALGPPNYQDPGSQISASTTATNDASPTIVRIPRATDGLFLARAKVKAFSQWTGNFDREQEVPAVPALVLEVKVPKWGEIPPNNNTGAEDEAESENDESIRGSKLPYYIRYGAANKAIIDSLPQVTQQAQLIFHGWKNLDSIWTVRASGRWVRFLKFNRKGTPELKAENLQHGQYFGGELDEEAIEVDSMLFRFIDDDGKYTEEFRRYWDAVMRDVEVQYEKCVLVGGGDESEGGE
ncbi:hypothetical protein BD779DRAFT_1576867 [Infundibulicybe gibba]|nr:hypothetical protein BD779DRAFT_1576867 [Infundibulicybe gibba]